MKINKWTLGLAAAGVVSFGAVAQAEEAKEAVKTAIATTTLSGYVSTSAWFNPGSAGARTPLPFSSGSGAAGAPIVPTKANNLNLDVFDLKLEKALSEKEWSAGYVAELWFGPDANALATSSSGVATADLAIKQAYVNLRLPVGNGIETKLGVFDTPLGYELANSGSNPNYTRSWGWAMEPTQHTGILASYRFCDWMSANAGIANSHGPQINSRSGAAEGQKTFMGSVTVTAPASTGFLKGATLTAGVMDGKSSGVPAGTSELTSIYVGATIPTPVQGLSAGLEYDLAHQKGAGNDTWATAAYLSYQVTKKLTLNLREDYIDSANGGVAIGLLGARAGSEILSSTLTADYALWANVISRLEGRWDHDMGGTPKAFGARNAILLALNVIYKF